MKITDEMVEAKAREIGSTEIYGETMTNLEYVLRRGASAVGLSPSYAKDMLWKLATCQLEEAALAAEGEAQGVAWRPEVAAFAHLMERELRANDHKGGWKYDSAFDLMDRVLEEAAELQEVITSGRDPIKVASEAADVANMAMMVADVCGCLAAAPAIPQPAAPVEYDLHCVHGHDLCYQGTDENCPYCERRPVPQPAAGLDAGALAEATKTFQRLAAQIDWDARFGIDTESELCTKAVVQTYLDRALGGTDAALYAYLCESPEFKTEIIHEAHFAQSRADRPERWMVTPLLRGTPLRALGGTDV